MYCKTVVVVKNWMHTYMLHLRNRKNCYKKIFCYTCNPHDMCYFVVNSLSPQRSPSNSMTTILNFKNPAALFKQPIKRKTGSVETLIDILPSVHRKSRSKKHSKLGVDTSYLRRLIEQQEEDQNKRFKQPGDVSNINIMKPS